MAEFRDVQKPERAFPVASRWLLDVENEDTQEPDLDPFGGRFCGDQVDYEHEDADFDRQGGYRSLFGL